MKNRNFNKDLPVLIVIPSSSNLKNFIPEFRNKYPFAFNVSGLTVTIAGIEKILSLDV
jgi:hypothetical protein